MTDLLPDDDDRQEALKEIEKGRYVAAMNAALASLETIGLDAVVILASYRHEDGDTGMLYRGVGNWYARAGMVRHQDEMMKESARVDERNK